MSFDTVHFRLKADEAATTDLLAETPCYLDGVKPITLDDGSTGAVGYLNGNGGGYKVFVSNSNVTLKECSLSKWYLGNNLSELDRKTTREAIEKLSDELHLPMDKALVTRLDFGLNIITQYPAIAYCNHLGALNHYNRFPQPTGLLYKQSCKQFAFYDKIKEQRKQGAFIPELYRNNNVLRIEERFMSRVSKQLGCMVDGGLLYDERFYNMMLNRWRDNYKAITKINDTMINLKVMNGLKELYKMGLLSLIERAGGQNEMMNQIKEAQQRGELNKKTASDMRKAIRAAGMVDEKIIIPNEAISELDEKVKRAVKFYR